MTRLTREQRQEQTRQRLLATAHELFLRDGYSATSLEHVAEEAGYSKGAVYSNFRSKDELCLEVLDTIRAERAGEIVTLVQAPTMDERIDRFATWAEQVIGDPQWTRLEMEFAVHASRDDELQEHLVTSLRQLIDVLAQAGTVAAAQPGDTAPPLPLRTTAIALLSQGIGLGLLRAIDPALPTAPMIETLQLLLGHAATTDDPDPGPRSAES